MEREWGRRKRERERRGGGYRIPQGVLTETLPFQLHCFRCRRWTGLISIACHSRLIVHYSSKAGIAILGHQHTDTDSNKHWYGESVFLYTAATYLHVPVMPMILLSSCSLCKVVHGFLYPLVSSYTLGVFPTLYSVFLAQNSLQILNNKFNKDVMIKFMLHFYLALVSFFFIKRS